MSTLTSAVDTLLVVSENLHDGWPLGLSFAFTHFISSSATCDTIILTEYMRKSTKKLNPIARKGLTIIYYGNGKGKTSAAVGLAVRAAGSGFNVFFLQFVKGEWPCGERDFFENVQQKLKGNKKKIGLIEAAAVGKGFVKILGDKKPFTVHQQAAKDGLWMAHEAMRSGKYQLVILDELISAFESKLLKISDLVKIVKEKPADLHLVLTGHVLPKQLATKADLVSEVNMIKHPYYKGILAQRGIDY